MSGEQYNELIILFGFHCTQIIESNTIRYTRPREARRLSTLSGARHDDFLVLFTYVIGTCIHRWPLLLVLRPVAAVVMLQRRRRRHQQQEQAQGCSSGTLCPLRCLETRWCKCVSIRPDPPGSDPGMHACMSCHRCHVMSPTSHRVPIYILNIHTSYIYIYIYIHNIACIMHV